MKKTGSMTPMMVQYLKTKEEYADCILFYRLGDFYEMFFDDAIKASRELEITLTGKDCGLEERAPMCGVPYHSAVNYITKLISKGYKVAVCEQVEDPKSAKGIVKREVIRVITPGTVTDELMLDEKSNNYLAVISLDKNIFGFAVSDASTGEMYATEVSDTERVLNEIARYEPKEIIADEAAGKAVSKAVELRFGKTVDIKDEDFFDDTALEKKLLTQFKKESLSDLKLADKPQAVVCAGVLIRYLEYAQRTSLSYISTLNVYDVEQYMDLDASARRNLEVSETMRDKQKKGSLLWVLDETCTSMGARMLKQWVEKPLKNPMEITERLNAVNELFSNMMLRDELREILNRTYDISRIISRVSVGTVSPKDLLSLKMTLCALPELEMKLNGTKSGILNGMSKGFDILEDLRELLENSIDDEAPSLLRDGNVIKAGFHEEIDRLRSAMKDGKKWLAQLEAREREKTGIAKLKVGYNKVFGYYFEVSKASTPELPDYFIRRQTLANAERYITPELKELEDTILGASERVVNLEAHIFERIRQKTADETDRLKRAANIIAVTDTICSLAETAYKNKFSMPVVNDSGKIIIEEGRHPVVEKMSKSLFVPNDVTLDGGDNRMLIITGPNMAGKSTYMRQTAIITLMAQIGSFVPAKSASIGVVDKIFTRVGASDDIASGQSTFMMEMTEVSHILKNATKNSLIILDEIGRGTSTYDGLSIAWAVSEYINKYIGAKTLFATHYHELTQLENMIDGVKNYHIAVRKHGDDITFLRKIVSGGTDDSFGIEVAALAGVPKKVIKQAKKVLEMIETGDKSKIEIKRSEREEETNQVSFLDGAAGLIAQELREIDVTTLSPIEAMNKLYELSEKAKGV